MPTSLSENFSERGVGTRLVDGNHFQMTSYPKYKTYPRSEGLFTCLAISSLLYMNMFCILDVMSSENDWHLPDSDYCVKSMHAWEVENGIHNHSLLVLVLVLVIIVYTSWLVYLLMCITHERSISMVRQHEQFKH